MSDQDRTAVDPDWPSDVIFVITTLETGRHRAVNRRSISRSRHRTKASLRLYSDSNDASPRVLYTRDVNPRGLGFITQHRLPLGYSGIVELATPYGGLVSVSCTVYRCTNATDGWYEGSLSFNREQWIFDSSVPVPKLANRDP